MKLKKWIPKEKIYSELIAKSCVVRETELLLTLKKIEGGNTVFIKFEEGFFAFRETEEDCIEKSLNQFDSLFRGSNPMFKEAWYLFTVENSEYVNRLKESALGFYDSEEITHYVIIAYDVVLEVLASSAPNITIQDES